MSDDTIKPDELLSTDELRNIALNLRTADYGDEKGLRSAAHDMLMEFADELDLLRLRCTKETCWFWHKWGKWEPYIKQKMIRYNRQTGEETSTYNRDQQTRTCKRCGEQQERVLPLNPV